MISNNKKKIILSVAILSIAMILTNILQAGIISFVPLEVKELSSDNIDEGIYQAPDIDEEVETVRTGINIESPIYIDDTAWNNWEYAKNVFDLDGDGTEGYPYVIKDLIIDCGGSATGSCISIKNSKAYFIIYNCMFYGSGFGGKDAGIRLINTNNGEIINNDVSQNLYGIWLKESNDNKIQNNILSENFASIMLSDSNDNTVIENIFSDHHIGILIMGTSSDNLIYINEFHRSSFRHAFYWLYSGSGNSWDNGVVGNYWDDYELKFPAATNDRLIWDHPYFIYYYYYNADNYPLVDPYEKIDPIHINNAVGNNWQWAKTQGLCTGSGTEEDPYVIKDLIIDGSWGSGIFIENSNAHFRIENCRIYHSDMAGIRLTTTSNGKIINNDLLNNFDYYIVYGIYLEDSNDNIISENTCKFNDDAIYLEDSNDNTISGNICNDNYRAIKLEYSNGNTISGNTCNDNDYGIHIRDYGAHNIISGNTLNGNEYHGIYLDGHTWESCWDNIIWGNNATYNGNGIYVLAGGDSDYPNIFLGNTLNYNGCGIRFFNSQYNVVSDNTAAYNQGSGIVLDYYSCHNYGIGNHLPNNGLGAISYGYGATDNDIGYTE